MIATNMCYNFVGFRYSLPLSRDIPSLVRETLQNYYVGEVFVNNFMIFVNFLRYKLNGKKGMV